MSGIVHMMKLVKIFQTFDYGALKIMIYGTLVK